MRHKCFAGSLLLLLLLSSNLGAQEAQSDAASAQSDKTPKHLAYYMDPATLNVAAILPLPPASDSAMSRAELADVHHAEQTRTPQQVAAAQADDQEQDIFIFRNLFGSNFTAEKLPVTAALSHHIHSDEGIITKPLKTSFARQRPFQFDNSLKPVCALSKEPNSYPSGHTVSGYLLALTLIQIIPEKQSQIMSRVDDYAHNRIVCGVHYPSDIEAGRNIAYLMFGYMLANPQFQKDLAAAREETRSRLGLPVLTPPS
jgi:acid phosphatase (class A)